MLMGYSFNALLIQKTSAVAVKRKDDIIYANDEDPSQPLQKRIRPSNIITSALAFFLDRLKISDRIAKYVLG